MNPNMYQNPHTGYHVQPHQMRGGQPSNELMVMQQIASGQLPQGMTWIQTSVGAMVFDPNTGNTYNPQTVQRQLASIQQPQRPMLQHARQMPAYTHDQSYRGNHYHNTSNFGAQQQDDDPRFGGQPKLPQQRQKEQEYNMRMTQPKHVQPQEVQPVEEPHQVEKPAMVSKLKPRLTVFRQDEYSNIDISAGPGFCFRTALEHLIGECHSAKESTPISGGTFNVTQVYYDADLPVNIVDKLSFSKEKASNQPAVPIVEEVYRVIRDKYEDATIQTGSACFLMDINNLITGTINDCLRFDLDSSTKIDSFVHDFNELKTVLLDETEELTIPKGYENVYDYVCQAVYKLMTTAEIAIDKIAKSGKSALTMKEEVTLCYIKLFSTQLWDESSEITKSKQAKVLKSVATLANSNGFFIATLDRVLFKVNVSCTGEVNVAVVDN